MCEWNKKECGFTKKFNVELFLVQSGFTNSLLNRIGNYLDWPFSIKSLLIFEIFEQQITHHDIVKRCAKVKLMLILQYFYKTPRET